MIIPKPAILLDRMQMIKTEGDKEFRFAKVILVKEHIFSKKLVPFDATTGMRVMELKHFNERIGKYLPADTSSIKSMGKGYGLYYTCAE